MLLPSRPSTLSVRPSLNTAPLSVKTQLAGIAEDIYRQSLSLSLTVRPTPNVSPLLCSQASDIDIYRGELRKTNAEVTRLLSKHTGHSQEEIARDISRPKYFNPYEASELSRVCLLFLVR